jgi:hypothetical protein
MTGYCPSLPPPLGRTTVLNAVREFIGTERYRRRTRKLKMFVSEMVLGYGQNAWVTLLTFLQDAREINELGSPS